MQNWYLNRLKFVVVTVFLRELYSEVQNVKLWALNVAVRKRKMLFGKLYFLVFL